ncbi:MAG TPA: SRPBCC family protein [Abditibacteriaceae bacterium]
MSVIVVRTHIAAPIELCFDLARDVDVHCQTSRSTQERIVCATKRQMELGDCVTFEGVHFGIRQQLSGRIVAYERPLFFADEMTRGAFKRLRHEHSFQAQAGGTLMTDRLDFASPLGVLGIVADLLLVQPHLRRFLWRRNRVLKRLAEQLARAAP